MKRFTAIILDDEPGCIADFKNCASELNDLELVGEASTVTDCLILIKERQPDLVFLDIQLMGESGFDLLDRLNDSKIDISVVFLTAFDNYAINAFRYHAADYLLKPASKESILNTLKHLEGKRVADLSYKLLREQSKKENYRRLIIPTNSSLEFVPLQDVIFCEADNSYTKVYTKEKEYLISKTLKSVEAMLDPDEFYRIHSSYTINLAYLKKYVRGAGGQAFLTNGKTLSVSSRRKEGFLRAVKNYTSKRNL
jgi:two-component system LytT family response regulator